MSLIILFRHFRARRDGFGIARFALLPLGYLVADLTENSALGALKSAQGFDAVASFASDATIVKYVLLGLSVLFILGVALMRKKERI